MKELEEQKTKEALEQMGRKHKLVKFENGRDRARMIQGVISPEPWTASSLDSCLPAVAQDADDAMSEWKERDGWSVDLEGDMEKLEVVGFVSGTEGGCVDPKREMGHWSAQIKTTKEGSDELKGADNEKQESEMEVYEATLQEARVEIQSPKRKVIRVESEETQDHVRETLAISQEEADGETIDAVKRPSDTCR